MPRALRLSDSRQQLIDCACLALFVLALAAPFLSGLGFYSDDWWVLHQFQNDFANHRFGLETMYRGFEARPLQGMYLAALYNAFGVDPLGYHLVNTAVLAAAVVALYRLLTRMRVERSIAFAAVAMFIILPQLSTARIWYSTFQIPLSMLFAMLSLHAQASFAQRGSKRQVAVAAIWAVLSIAVYEIFAPLIIAFPVWLIFEARREKGGGFNARRYAWLAITALVTVALTVVAKGAVSDRAQSPDLHMYMKGLLRLVKPDYDWRVEGSLNIFATIEVNLWQPIAGFVRGIAVATKGELAAAALLAGAAVALLSFWRLATRKDDEHGGLSALGIFLVGVLAFLAGHATFLINSQILFSPTGIGNRALVGMAPGLALAAAGLIAVACRAVQPKRGFLFAAVISLVVLAGAWRTEQIYKYWAESWVIEQSVLASARADLKDLPANSTVIFDGVCPYHGPGIIMETWEAADMLSLTLGREIWADTASDRMEIRPEGLITTMYNERQVYAYGPNLYVYHPGRHFLLPLSDRETAFQYFEASTALRKCPQGYVGQGVLI